MAHIFINKVVLHDVEMFKVEELEAKVERGLNLRDIHQFLPEPKRQQIPENWHPERVAHR